ILVVTNEAYVKLVKEQLPDLDASNILSEPARKNTAPCIAYAAYRIASINPKGLMVVAPSDHLITKEETFLKAIRSCFRKAASEDCLVTLGISPTRPDTGYGYIQFKESDVKEKDNRIKKVKTFTEKPDQQMARSFLDSGDFLWNSGIFIWSVPSILKELERNLPEINSLFSEGIAFYNTPKEKAFIKEAYSKCKNISIDYAVMEKAENVYVRSSIIGWSDLGTWGSLYDHIGKNEDSNAVVGKNVMLYQAKNCIVHVPKDKLVVIEGLEGYIVAESDGILLICKKKEEQQIRNIVNDVKVKHGDRFV
ncbi:MAG TPA: mannose-1-phosphate guanylyltransferase, partial [Bacteroidia bacterium]|nr:mannose-1-phosphate guanylyltransferase [Bacteroidia bacterium]